MADHLFIVPGYSDVGFSFLPLANLLVAQDVYKKENIWTIEYASLDDQVGFRDFGRKLDEIYNEFSNQHPGTRVDIIAHSTGSLVVRTWLLMRRKRQRATNQVLDVPVDHLYLFAPANFGSDLAKVGRSGLNAVRVTFTKINNEFMPEGGRDPFETGKRVLEGLEPASPHQWELSTGDLHDETYFGEHDETGLTCYLFVFSAGRAFKTPESIIVRDLQKDGTDSTVRIAGTSLNTRMFTLRSKDVIGGSNLRHVQVDNEWVGNSPDQRRKFERIAFAVFGDYDHCGIINDNGKLKRPQIKDKDSIEASNWNPALPSSWEPLELLKKAKAVVNPQEYKALSLEFANKTEAYIKPKEEDPRQGIYQQFFFKVTDDTGQSVNDFFVQFYVYDNMNSSDSNEGLTRSFRDLFGSNASFQFHSKDNSCGVLMLDITEVKDYLSKVLVSGNLVKLKITAKAAYNGVSFPDSEFVIYEKRQDSAPQIKVDFFSPFTTTLVKVVLYRKIDQKIMSVGLVD